MYKEKVLTLDGLKTLTQSYIKPYIPVIEDVKYICDETTPTTMQLNIDWKYNIEEDSYNNDFYIYNTAKIDYVIPQIVYYGVKETVENEDGTTTEKYTTNPITNITLSLNFYNMPDNGQLFLIVKNESGFINYNGGTSYNTVPINITLPTKIYKDDGKTLYTIVNMDYVNVITIPNKKSLELSFLKFGDEIRIKSCLQV